MVSKRGETGHDRVVETKGRDALREELFGVGNDEKNPPAQFFQGGTSWILDLT